MRNYRTNNQLADLSPFVLKKIEISKKWGVRLAPPIPQRLAPRPVLQVVLTLLILASLAILYALNKPRLDAYNDCYMQNYIEWGSCQELGGDYR